ncbi:MAG: hypothetical protein E7451_02225 [Ruminococcaceae bacterium]|nr:hypothetical protein [Oscillospiraceae bacterium]
MEQRELLEMIDRAGERELNAVVLRLLNRYGELFPKEEMLFLSLPLEDREERKRILGELYQQLMNRTI